ncbi:glycosyltransferase [Aureivirga marina]|uniref:glycosyltransferase n=1 Tax=Aureivirga marina TaxID=1182451 RepID=UPI0018C97AA5|nr:glycosyltransferase [Aureivirga marina]
MKNILIVNDTWNLVNGITTIYQNMLEEFKKQHDLNFIFVYPSTSFEVNYLDQNIIECGLPLKVKIKLPFYKEITQGIPNFNWYETLQNKFGDMDLIHITTQGVLGYYFSKVSKRYNIYSTGFYHTFMPLFAQKYMPKRFPFLKKLSYQVLRKFDKMVYRNCSEIFYHTEDSKTYLENLFSNKKYTSITALIPLKKIVSYRKEQKKVISKEKPIVFGYIGRLAKEKNIEAIVRLEPYFVKNNIKFVFIGDGPMTDYIKENSSLEVTGYLKNEALFKQIQRLDFNIIPSATDTLNMTLLESASQQIPSIGFYNSVPSKLIVKYESGMTYTCFKNPNWIKDFRNSITQDKYNELQNNCLSLIEGSDISNGSRKIISSWVKPRYLNELCLE